MVYTTDTVAKHYTIKTFGCQMNEHDSQKIAVLLGRLGFSEAVAVGEADLVLFNTCTVRAKAHQKAFSEIGKIEKRGPREPIIGVCGCVAQEEGVKLVRRFPSINLVFGPDQIDKLPDLLDIVRKGNKPAVATELINNAEDYTFLDTLSVTRLHGPTAFVTIMKGCNSQCSYCIVPKVRGSEVYRPYRDIVREVDSLSDKGCKEVTLLGQNVNSYKDPGDSRIGFADLIRILTENTPVYRIRFTSPHPKDCKEDLIREYGRNKTLAPHMHLPLQSGADSVLRRMRRAYNTTLFQKKTQALRAARPGMGITSDVIVGFPGETDEEFQETLAFVERIGFDNIYAFKYSPRPDTEAFALEDDVPMSLKEERLAKLLTLQREISRLKNEPLLGTIEEVLTEGGDKRGKGRMSGRTGSNKIVNFSGYQGKIGDIVKVQITKTFPFSLEGEVRR